MKFKKGDKVMIKYAYDTPASYMAYRNIIGVITHIAKELYHVDMGIKNQTVIVKEIDLELVVGQRLALIRVN